MALEKQDLQEIKKIVIDSEKRMVKRVDQTKFDLEDKIEFFIEKSEIKMEKKIASVVKASEERINQNIKQEVTDLSDINRAAFMRTDQLEYRLQIVERKLGIKT